jgi:Bacterial Ig-like domain/PKD domain
VRFIVDTQAPAVTLAPLRSPTNESAPVFQGTATESTPVTVQIHAGEDATGPIVATAGATGTGGAWSSAPASPPLHDGSYTAVARQESAAGNHPGETAPYTFRVDTVPPRLSLDSPPQGSSAPGDTQVVSGTGDVAGDVLPHVTVELFAGPGITEGQGPLLLATVNVGAGRWTATLAGLSAGTYTVRAVQSDQAGNVGTSSPRSFTLTGRPGGGAPARAPSPPGASFTWVPASPHAGERISLVSTSTDPTSPLTSFAWDLSGTNSFQAGGPLMTTSFASAGNHVVRLRVSDAAGLSSAASQTIPVRPAVVPLMRPFPMVRIVTTRAAHGVRLKLLAVQAPAGSRMSVRCTGRGCPAKSQSRVASAGHGGLAAVQFRRFERILPVGMTLEVRVYKPGQVGKYTRLSIRRGSRPKRDDKCLAPEGVKPIACPRS